MPIPILIYTLQLHAHELRLKFRSSCISCWWSVLQNSRMMSSKWRRSISSFTARRESNDNTAMFTHTEIEMKSNFSAFTNVLSFSEETCNFYILNSIEKLCNSFNSFSVSWHFLIDCMTSLVFFFIVITGRSRLKSL